jgi:ATP-binding cassette, subfamily B, bacterial MsbA
MRQLARLIRYLRPYWLQFTASVLLMAVVGAMDAFRVLLVGPVFDRVLNPASNSANIALFRIPHSGGHVLYLQQLVPERFTNAWTIVAFCFVAATVIKGITDFIGTYLVNYAGFGMMTDLRNDLYASILQRSVAFFQSHTTGTLLSTTINDIERVQYAMSTVLAEFLQQFFTLIFTAVVVIVLGGKLAWVLLIFVPVIIASALRIGRRVRSTTRKGQDKLADIQNILHETITGVRIVKAFGMEMWETVRFRGAAKKLFKANIRSVTAAAVSSPLMDIFGAIAIALLLLLGRDRINKGMFTPGTFLAFIIAVFKLYDPVRKFAQFNNNFQQALGASASIFAFMNSRDEVRESANARELGPFSDSIDFDNVWFEYAQERGERRQVLRGVSLRVQRGEVIAIVGSSGAGKSTLVHLIPRFFDPSSGALRVDGQNVRDVTVASLRSQIGIVTQDTVLFNDTIRNNIAYGQPQLSRKQVEAAAHAAMAHDFILRLSNGYDTVIGERGLRLSGGERQRIAIARAILKNAPILILDEATSALDSENEALVQSALHNLMEGRTVFVIAHRLSTIRHADRIVVMEGGRVADVGCHDELMSRIGTYRRLYDLQFMDLDAANGHNGAPEPAAKSGGVLD